MHGLARVSVYDRDLRWKRCLGPCVSVISSVLVHAQGKAGGSVDTAVVLGAMARVRP